MTLHDLVDWYQDLSHTSAVGTDDCNNWIVYLAVCPIDNDSTLGKEEEPLPTRFGWESALMNSPPSITWSQRKPLGSGSLVCLPSLTPNSSFPNLSPDSGERWGLLEAKVSS